jgi:GntR family transcriptional regulator/MocR family aminotransferase
MSLQRRIALLEWAERSGAWILEDDYDSEFRYVGRPLSALPGLDRSGRVIYIGTFSKVLLPTLRIGYLVVPPDLVEAFRMARTFAAYQSPLFDQVVINDFMTEGHFSHHIRRMRTLYAERKEVLLAAARQELDGLLDIRGSETGLSVVGWLPPGVDDRAVTNRADQLGIYVRPLSQESIEPLSAGGLLLGYAAIDNDQIREGARRLAEAIRQVIAASNTSRI